MSSVLIAQASAQGEVLAADPAVIDRASHPQVRIEMPFPGWERGRPQQSQHLQLAMDGVITLDATRHARADAEEAVQQQSQHLHLGVDGVITLDGTRLALAAAMEAVQARARAEPVLTQVSAAGDLSFGQVVELLTVLSQAPDANLSVTELEDFSTFGTDDLDDRPVASGNAFRGLVRQNELPVLIVFSQEYGCAAVMNDRMLSSDDLYHQVFAALDTWARQAGGFHVVMRDSEVWNSVVATIQAQPDTPWRCIAGATFNIQATGYPAVQFEVVDGS